jgi:cellulose synthase (UDP-forming)
MNNSQPHTPSIGALIRQWRMTPLRAMTLFLLSMTVISAAIGVAWFAGQGTISTIFQQLNGLQENPPLWLEAPMMIGEYLLFWTVLLLLFVLAITKISPRPRTWSRLIVISILLILTVRYLLWRCLTTLNLSTPLNGVFSLGLLFLELLMLTGGLIQLVLLLRVSDRRSEADQLSVNVANGSFRPTVDILIPTYNEAEFILKRTIIGCQALDYQPKTIYVLDDTRRPEIKALAKELGCEYLTRPDNRNAKAGNLNHAISQTQGELIVVFDADFVPTRNFLRRTVGFFQDSQVALVQTPQTFYNPDPIARNLGLEDILTPEEEVFYRQIQPIRDAAGSVICAGTSFIVSRAALTATGCFVTESLSEDYFTGIRLSAQGYRLVYLNEKLSAGLAAENISSQALQRIRWAQGTLQAFFVKSNPLTIPGLSLIQRLAHFEGLLHWFTSLSRVGFLLIPLAYSFLGVIPLRATGADVAYFFLPYYLTQLVAFSWLNYRSRSALLADVYSLVLAFPLAIAVIRAMLNPFGMGFKVTPKGAVSSRFLFNWQLALPLLIMFIFSAVSLWINLGRYLAAGMWQTDMPLEIASQLKGLGIGWIWSIYNLLTLAVSLLVLTDAPRPSPYEWYGLHRTVQLQIGEQFFWGFTTAISEIGAEVALTRAGLPAETEPVRLEFMEHDLSVQGQVTRLGAQAEFSTVQVLFEPLTLNQQRVLVEMLFCRPGQWQSRCAPGELRSLWLLFKILFRPRILFDRKVDVRVIAVSQVQ